MNKVLFAVLLGVSALSAQSVRFSVDVVRPYRSELFDHVQYDLERAARNSYPNGRIEKAFKELGQFRIRYNAGQPAKHELDSAIAAVRDLAKSDVLRPRDRDTMQNDLISMRQFRLNYRAGVY